MEHAIPLLTVFGLAAVELWAAIPAGFAFGMDPAWIGSVSALGAILGALLVSVAGEGLRTWIMRRRGVSPDGEKKEGLVLRTWRRYGPAGLGLLAPLVTGAPLGVALGLALGAPSGRLLLWVSAGIVLWSVLLTLAGYLGLAGFEKL